MTVIAVSTTTGTDGEYARAVVAAGGSPQFLKFDAASIDTQLSGVAGVLVSGGGDVDPRHYGAASALATEIDERRDAFELALVRRAREHNVPTLCICRGLQVANVAFGGSLVPDIAAEFGPSTAALHRREADGQTVRGLIAGHRVAIAPNSLLASITGPGPVSTGSRHHQSIAAVAPDLRVVGSTPDGIVEAVEAHFASPFWLAVQWHPESTLSDDGGVSAAIFKAFISAAASFGEAARR